MAEVSLFYDSINRSAKSTIVLIHGACCSGSNWDLVVPHLTTYHLIIPDLPGHRKSQHITPFSVKYSALLLAQIIRKHAINGRAHIVGHSLGAHVAISLASSHPDAVIDVFISGFEIYPPTTFSSLAPYAIWLDHRIQRLVPQFLISWLMDGTDTQRGEAGSSTMALCRQIAPAMITTSWPTRWPARTLIVAAGKGGIIPSKDHPHDAVKLMEIGRKGNPETHAIVHPKMRHPWNRQDPLLFAETARAWFEGKNIPAEFVNL
jgi:pimeloyl-ACP methyl ester carboxylesterase